MEERLIRTLKRDSFGQVDLVERSGILCVRRTASGGKIPGSGILGRIFARREQRHLETLREVEQVPKPLGRDGRVFYRTFIEGVQLNEAKHVEASYFEELFRVMERIHAAGVTHNDLAKEANILIDPQQRPHFLDFQLAFRFRSPNSWLCRSFFQMLCREDRRHLLKQKARHRPDLMTEPEWVAMRKKSWIARVWSATGMKIYHAITRPLGWRDDEGRGNLQKEKS